MKLGFVRLVDVDDDIFYVRISKINSIYVDSDRKCTAVELECGDVYYVKGSVDGLARSFLEHEIGCVYSYE